MNILQMEDMVKGLPDQILMQEAQMPSGQIPQFLALSEVQRRQEMRQRFQEPPESTVADQILQGGIASAMPQQAPQQLPAAPQGMPMGQPQAQPPVMMAEGGFIGGAKEFGKAYADMARQQASTPRGLLSFVPGVGGLMAAAQQLGSLRRYFPSTPEATGFGKYFPEMNKAGLSLGRVDTVRADPNLVDPESDALDRQYQALVSSQQNAMYAPFHSTMTGFDPTAGGTYDPGSQVMSSIGGPNIPGGMANGGMVPSGIVRMQNLGQVPNESPALRRARIYNEIRNARMAGADPQVIKELEDQLRILTPAGTLSAGAAAQQGAMNQPMFEAMNIAPTMETPTVSMDQPEFDLSLPPAAQTASVPAAAPAGVAPDATAMGTLPTEDAVLSAENISNIFSNVLGGMGTSSSLPTNIEARTKELRDFLGFDPNDPALQPTDLSPLMKQERERATKRAESYEQTIKNIENEMKRERLGAVLTTLGANLMAGEGALGLEKAGKLAQEMGKEARQEVAAERRAAREAEEASTDRLFALNAQQLSANKESQREIFKMQQGLNESVLNALIKAGESDRASKAASAQVAATLTSTIVNSIRDIRNNTGANRRTALDYAQGVVKEQLATLSTKPEFLKLNQEQVDQLMKDLERKALQTAADFLGIEIPEGFGEQRGATSASGRTSGRFAVSRVSGP